MAHHFGPLSEKGELWPGRRVTAVCDGVLSVRKTTATLRLVAHRPVQSAEVRALPNAFESDAALANALVVGNPAATRALWDRYVVLVRRLLQRTLVNDGVDDMVQETFLRVFRRIGSLREPSKLRSFVVGVSMRVAREELRRRRVRKWLRLTPSGELPERRHEGGDGRDRVAVEALARLDELLTRLDDASRLVFVLRFVEDVPTADIAETLGCSLATAKRRVKRARDKVDRLAALDPLLRGWVGQRDEAGGGDE
jgi:RNA polymerase sigma-70 factor, ECF subfamily